MNKQAMTQTLANCPFCGGHGGIFSDDGDYFIGCGQCWSRSPNKQTEAEAIAAWNARAPTPPNPSEPLVERALSQERANNPHEPFSDEAGIWNEGFCAAWETVRAALTKQGG